MCLKHRLSIMSSEFFHCETRRPTEEEPARVCSAVCAVVMSRKPFPPGYAYPSAVLNHPRLCVGVCKACS